MEIYRQKQLLLALVIILAILNLGMIGYLLYDKVSPSTKIEEVTAPQPTTDSLRSERPYRADRLQNRFGFDDEQMQQMEELRVQHHAIMRRLTDSIRQLRTRQTELVANHEENQEQVYEYAHEIGTLYSQIHIHTMDHFQKIKDLANSPQQVEAVNEFLRSAAMHKNRSKGDRRKHRHDQRSQRPKQQ